MLDINSETPLSLADAAKSLPPINGRRIHTSTLWRWMRRGVRGARLEHARLGRRVVTSREALARFASRLAEVEDTPRHAASPVRTPSRTPAQRSAAIARAERELETKK